MKYFILNGRDSENAPEGVDFDAVLAEHKVYTSKFFADGTLLFGGPKPAGSGVMVVRGESEEWAKEFGENDPLVKSGLQKYDVIEFYMFKCQDSVREWFE